MREVLALEYNDEGEGRAHKTTFKEALKALQKQVSTRLLSSSQSSWDKWNAWADSRIVHQLRAIVASLGVRAEQKSLVMPYGNSLTSSILGRRQRVLDDIIHLDIISRMTEGLEQQQSSLWYGGKLVPANSCKLAARPQSRQFLEYMKDQHNVNITVPRLVLDIDASFSMTDGSGSRSNPYHVAAAMREISRLLQRGITRTAENCIETPYRAQANLYRNTIVEAEKMEEWKGLEVMNITVTTVDSLQGGESQLNRPSANEEDNEMTKAQRAGLLETHNILRRLYKSFKEEYSVTKLFKAQLDQTLVSFGKAEEFRERDPNPDLFQMPPAGSSSMSQSD
ncbi:MAG: hypothetical protein Q9181_004931 [Wetmoreana brouardii]